MEMKDVTPTPKQEENHIVTPTPKREEIRVDFSTDMKDYTITEKISQGQYGMVYKCIHLGDGKQYAMKKVKLAGKGIHKLGNALIEADILARFRHPNLTRGYVTFLSGETIVNILEFSPLTVSDKYLSSLDIPNALFFMWQLLQGLDFLHTHNVIHGDIKPENLLIVNGVLKIADFGISQKNIAHPHRKNYQIQPILFRAPEVFLKANHMSVKADIWSVGILFMKLLTGKYILGNDTKSYPECIWRKVGVPSSKWMKNNDAFLNPALYPKKQPSLEISAQSVFSSDAKFIDMASTFLTRMVQVEPEKRASCSDLLADPIFGLMAQNQRSWPKVSDTFCYNEKDQHENYTMDGRHLRKLIGIASGAKLQPSTILLAMDMTIRLRPESKLISTIVCVAATMNESYEVDTSQFISSRDKLFSRLKQVCDSLNWSLYPNNIATSCQQDPQLVLESILKNNLLDKKQFRTFSQVCLDVARCKP